MLDPVNDRGRIVVVARDGADDQTILVIDDLRLLAGARLCGQVLDIEGHLPREIRQIGESALRPEQQVHKLARGGKIGVLAVLGLPLRPEDFEADRGAGLDGPGLEQARQPARVIGVQMREQLDIRIRQRQSRFAQAHEAARPGIHKDARGAVNEDKVA